MSTAGSGDKLAGGLDVKSSGNFKSNNLLEFNTPPGLWKRGKGMEKKKVPSLKGREPFVLRDYLLGLSPIFWILLLI